MADVRLIDANAVVTIQVFDEMTEEYNMETITVAKAIDRWSDEGCPPTIDAVEVVRCWKCKHYTPTICHRLNTVVTPLDFCSYGKPKMDAKEEDK